MPPSELYANQLTRERFSWLFLPGYGSEYTAPDGRTRWRCNLCKGPPSKIRTYCNSHFGNMVTHMDLDHNIPEGTVPGQPQYDWEPYNPRRRALERHISEPATPEVQAKHEYSSEPRTPPRPPWNRVSSELAAPLQETPARSEDELSQSAVGVTDYLASVDSTPTPTAPRRRVARRDAPTEQAARERMVSSEPLEYASSEEVPEGGAEDVSVQICTAVKRSTARIVRREVNKALKEVKRSIRRERNKRRWERKETRSQARRDLKELKRGAKREMKEMRKDMREGMRRAFEAAKSAGSHSTIEELVWETDEVNESEGDEE